MMKTYYYSDPLNDDFALSNGKIKKKLIDKDYKYIHRNVFYRTGSFILYRLIATPIGFLITRLGYGVKIKNRKAIKKIKGGFFLYGNHTNGILDVFSPSFSAFPHKTHIVSGPEGVSMPVIGKITPMLGAVPLPSTLGASKNFLSALKTLVEDGHVITIYPEAHIWPYYNDIRPFTDSSFAYPMKLNAPVVAFTVTYRKRKIFKKMRPFATITLSDPFYPSDFADKTELRNAVYNFMTKTIETEGTVEYNKYIYVEDKNENNDCV